MVLSESVTVAYGSAQPRSPHQPPRPQDDAPKDISISSLNKPSSIFSLTLDEIQLKSGKPFGSMNMDEFLTNLWSSVDDNQALSQPDRTETIDSNNIIIESQQQPPPLTRQNSFSIPIQICKKTVEEVWSDILKDQPQHQKLVDNDGNRQSPQRQQTFGEITLEEFLIKAGIVQEPAKPSQPKIVAPTPIQSSNTCMDASYGMGNMMGLGFSNYPSVGNNFLVNSYPTYPMYAPAKRNVVGEMLPNNAESTEKSLGAVEAGGVKNGKRRIIDGPPEVVVERRQRRMIKNRESAARSRARKQAYTVELEVELNQLKEENEKLKQIVKEYEEKQGQENEEKNGGTEEE